MHTANQKIKLLNWKNKHPVNLLGSLQQRKNPTRGSWVRVSPGDNASASPVAQLVEQQAKNMRSRIFKKVSSFPESNLKMKVPVGRRPLIPPIISPCRLIGKSPRLGRGHYWGFEALRGDKRSVDETIFTYWSKIIKGFLQQEKIIKTDIRKDVWVRVPQREKSPMAKLVDALVKKPETWNLLKDCYSKN